MIDIDKDFSSAFKAARTAAGLTQRGIEDLLGIPYRTVQSWEGGINTPPEWAQRLILDKLERLAEKCDAPQRRRSSYSQGT